MTDRPIVELVLFSLLIFIGLGAIISLLVEIGDGNVARAAVAGTAALVALVTLVAIARVRRGRDRFQSMR